MRRLALWVGLFALLIPASVGMMKMKNRIATRLTLMLLALALASPALATDGVLEINETCAQVGCFNGDSPGWPVTIIRAGSYRLTSNLNISDENTTAISVGANDVGIDLNNFSIIGPVTCSGSPFTCSHASGVGRGLGVLSPIFVGTSVKNGSISGMGSYGVALGIQAEVTNLRVRWNRSAGIFVGYGSTVSDNTAYRNGADGIWVIEGSTVSGNTVHNNGGDGIDAAAGSTVMGNTAYGNTGYGLQLDATLRAGYRDNVITDNTLGTVNGGIDAGGNVCNATTTCP